MIQPELIIYCKAIDKVTPYLGNNLNLRVKLSTVDVEGILDQLVSMFGVEIIKDFIEG